MSFVPGTNKNEIYEQSSISHPIENTPDWMPYQQLPSINYSNNLWETPCPLDQRLSICEGKMPHVVRYFFYLKQLGATLWLVHLNQGKLPYMLRTTQEESVWNPHVWYHQGCKRSKNPDVWNHQRCKRTHLSKFSDAGLNWRFIKINKWVSSFNSQNAIAVESFRSS